MRTLINWLYRRFLRADIKALEIHYADLTRLMRTATSEEEFYRIRNARETTKTQLTALSILHKSLLPASKIAGVPSNG
jgi:hypothetical protein